MKMKNKRTIDNERRKDKTTEDKMMMMMMMKEKKKTNVAFLFSFVAPMKIDRILCIDIYIWI